MSDHDTWGLDMNGIVCVPHYTKDHAIKYAINYLSGDDSACLDMINEIKHLKDVTLAWVLVTAKDRMVASIENKIDKCIARELRIKHW